MRRILWLLGVAVVAGVATVAGRAPAAGVSWRPVARSSAPLSCSAVTRQCDEFQCAWANLGEDPECYAEGKTVEIPCCSIKCVCSEDPEDCIWQIGTEDR